VDVVAGCVGDVQADPVCNNERHGFGFELARISRIRAIVDVVEQLVRVLMRKHEEPLRGSSPLRIWMRPPLDVPSAPLRSSTPLERDTRRDDGGFEGGGCGAGIAGCLGDVGQRLAVGLLHVEHVRGAEANDPLRLVVLIASFGVPPADDWREDRDSLLAAAHESPEATPSVDAGHTAFGRCATMRQIL
jgi:hypothetical protein